jgi:hypothetical protein
MIERLVRPVKASFASDVIWLKDMSLCAEVREVRAIAFLNSMKLPLTARIDW